MHDPPVVPRPLPERPRSLHRERLPGRGLAVREDGAVQPVRDAVHDAPRGVLVHLPRRGRLAERAVEREEVAVLDALGEGLAGGGALRDRVVLLKDPPDAGVLGARLARVEGAHPDGDCEGGGGDGGERGRLIEIRKGGERISDSRLDRENRDGRGGRRLTEYALLSRGGRVARRVGGRGRR